MVAVVEVKFHYPVLAVSTPVAPILGQKDVASPSRSVIFFFFFINSFKYKQVVNVKYLLASLSTIK